MEKPKVMIVGFGWACTGFIKEIDTTKYDVTIISNNTQFQFTPLLVKNLLTNNKVSFSLDEMRKNIHIIEDQIEEFDIEENKIISNKEKYNYDYLIFSHGSDVNTFNIPGVEKYTYFLKTSKDSEILKSKLNSLPKGSNITVIGCGLTGSEIVGALIDFNKFNIFAIDRLEMPLSTFSSKLSNNALDLWRENRVNLYFNKYVSNINDKEIQFKNDNEKIQYDIAIWCGGIKSSNLTQKINDKLNIINKKGIIVNDYLQVKNYSKIYAIGDCTYTKNPPTAQVAFQQGLYLADQFNNQFEQNKPFHYIHRGQFAYIGKKKSIYENRYFSTGGNLTYYINNFICLYNTINMKK